MAGDLTKFEILEIGPGPGGLTRGLLSEGAQKVVVIEKDKRCISALRIDLLIGIVQIAEHCPFFTN